MIVQLDDDATVILPKKVLQLNYVTTVHSSQGSQAADVLFLVPSHHSPLTCNLVYTAISRAKERCFIVGNKTRFLDSRTNREKNRRSTLVKRLTLTETLL
jgi:exodeoxyribonuclease V alpha subunit